MGPELRGVHARGRYVGIVREASGALGRSGEYESYNNGSPGLRMEGFGLEASGLRIYVWHEEASNRSSLSAVHWL